MILIWFQFVHKIIKNSQFLIVLLRTACSVIERCAIFIYFTFIRISCSQIEQFAELILYINHINKLFFFMSKSMSNDREKINTISKAKLRSLEPTTKQQDEKLKSWNLPKILISDLAKMRNPSFNRGENNVRI